MEFFQYFANFDFSKYTIDLHNGICTEDKGMNCIRVLNPCEKDHNICKNVKKKNLQRFQTECQLALERLENKENISDNSPWGLSYVVNPALMMSQGKQQSDTFNLADSLRMSSNLSIESLYEEEEEEFAVETENFKKTSAKVNKGE